MITLAPPKIPAINLAMDSTNTAHSSAVHTFSRSQRNNVTNTPLVPSYLKFSSPTGKPFVLAGERGLRYSSSWTYHLNRIIIVHNPQNAQSLLRVSEEFRANMLRYPLIPEGILRCKVATAVAENEHQHMRVLPRMIKERSGRGRSEAIAEKKRKEDEHDREIERTTDEYIEDCAEGIE